MCVSDAVSYDHNNAFKAAKVNLNEKHSKNQKNSFHAISKQSEIIWKFKSLFETFQNHFEIKGPIL